MSRMSRADRKRWAATRTLPDVGEVMALWLEGEVKSWPGYAPDCGPDEETTELIPTLAALNRAGFVTISSQPGLAPTRGWDGRMWEQRAAVEGFADRCTADSLGAAAEDAGMLVIRRYTRRRVFGRFRSGAGAVPVTASGARVHTAFGGELDATDVEFILGGIGDTAMAEVLDAYQVTVIDPAWGSNALWPALAGALR